MDCKWRDGEFYPARVIERRPVEGTDKHEYYVHYSKCEPFQLPMRSHPDDFKAHVLQEIEDIHR